MKILLADDDPIIRLDLRHMLENIGYTVVAEAEDGVQAAALAESEKPDVCLFDVKMPGMDGIDAASKVAEAGIAPVVLLTAYSDEELIKRAASAGVFGYLVKPFKPNDLAPAIEVARQRFEANAKLTKELHSVEERLEARKSIEKAKGLLMKVSEIDEAEAYRRIQTQSMQNRKSMKEVADAIILAHGSDA